MSGWFWLGTVGSRHCDLFCRRDVSACGHPMEEGARHREMFAGHQPRTTLAWKGTSSWKPMPMCWAGPSSGLTQPSGPAELGLPGTVADRKLC